MADNPTPYPASGSGQTQSGFLAQVPGFRSNRGWKKVVALLVYLVIALWILQSFAKPVLGVFGLLTLGIVFLVTNMRGVRDRIPMFKSKNKAVAASAWAGLGLTFLFVGALAAPGGGSPAPASPPVTARSGTNASPAPDPSASAQSAVDKAAADTAAAQKAAADQAAADKAAADKAAADKVAADKAAALAKRLAPSPAQTTCPVGEDIIVRWTVPGLSPVAQALGSISLVNNCEPTAGLIQRTSPLGAGYCTEVARSADNPGYNFDADPAPRLHKLIFAVGGGC